MMEEPIGPTKTGLQKWRRWVLPAALVAGLIAFFALGLGRYLTFQSLEENRSWLLAAVARHYGVMVIAFVALYALATALSLPGATMFTLTGGFLFGLVPGTAYAVTGATIGAAILFVVAKSSFGERLRARASGFVQRLAEGFQRDALSYLLFLRLVPLFPFWLVNLVPAFLGVSLRIFVVGTFFGIIPGAFVYASIGNGLGVILDQGRQPDLGIVLRPQILLPILALAVLALVPVVHKRVSRRGKPKDGKMVQSLDR